MKALIVYDHIGSAVKASTALREATSCTEAHAAWEIKLWRSDEMRFRRVADDALGDAGDADLVICAVRQARLLPPWVKEWLQRWATQRQVVNAALALVVDKTDHPSGTEEIEELYHFAMRHNLTILSSPDDERQALAAFLLRPQPEPAWIAPAGSLRAKPGLNWGSGDSMDSNRCKRVLA